MNIWNSITSNDGIISIFINNTIYTLSELCPVISAIIRSSNIMLVFRPSKEKNELKW